MRRFLQNQLSIQFSELKEDEYNFVEIENEDETYISEADTLDSFQLTQIDYDQEAFDHESYPLDDWEGDYYLSNNQQTNDMLTGTYYKIKPAIADNDLNDLLDEENLFSFNNGVYGAEDFDDPLDVRHSYTQ